MSRKNTISITVSCLNLEYIHSVSDLRVICSPKLFELILYCCSIHLCWCGLKKFPRLIDPAIFYQSAKDKGGCYNNFSKFTMISLTFLPTSKNPIIISLITIVTEFLHRYLTLSLLSRESPIRGACIQTCLCYNCLTTKPVNSSTKSKVGIN